MSTEAGKNNEASALRSILEALEDHRAEWFLPVLLMLARDGLASLRTYLENPDEKEITWSHPAVELRWPVPWDWARWDKEGGTWAGPEPADILRLAESGDVAKAADAVVDLLVLNTLQRLASRAFLEDGGGVLYGFAIEGGELRALLPKALEEELGLEAMSEQERKEVLAELFRPFTFNRDGLNRLDPRFTEDLAANFIRGVCELAQEAKAWGKEGAEFGDGYVPFIEEGPPITLEKLEALRREGKPLDQNRPDLSPREAALKGLVNALIEADENARRTVARLREANSEPRKVSDEVLKWTEEPDYGLKWLEDPFQSSFTLEGERKLEISVRLAVHPYVVDLDERRVYFPATVGIVATEGGMAADLSELPNEAKGRFWETVFKVLDLCGKRGLADVVQDIRRRSIWEVTAEAGEPTKGGGAHDGATMTEAGRLELTILEAGKTAAAVLTPMVKAGPPQEYHLLLDGPTRMDRAAALLLARTGKVTLPRKWGSVPRWEDEAAQARDRFLEELGQAAFVATDQRGPLLERRATFTGPKNQRVRRGVVMLTPEGEEAVLEALAWRPFRRLTKDDDGVTREYLIKRVRVAGGGVLEARLSWYGRAWRLVDSAREEQQKALEAERKRLDGTFFEMLDPEVKDRLDSELQHMQAVRDARLVMEYVLAVFGRDGRNPVTINARDFRSLLECENDPNGLRRIRGCLRALQELRYSVVATGTQPSFRSWGPFLASVAEMKRGAEGQGGAALRGDVDFRLQLGDPFVGCLKVFEAGTHRIKDARHIFVYDWSRKLTKAEQKALGREGYVQGFSSLGAFFDRAKGFSDQQRRLRQWIEGELTLRRDATRKGRGHLRAKPSAPDAREPRVYDSSFCPVLPEGRRFHGALGHFKHNPESGRTLYGSGSAATVTSGAKTEGLLSVMGYEVPGGPGGAKRAAVLKSALEDLLAVVEEAMGGVVVAHHGGRWYGLEEAANYLPERELGGAAKWFLFPAEDWRERIPRAIEDHHEKRHARGETPYKVKVTRDREAHRRAAEAHHGVRLEADRTAAGDAQAVVPLHHRLLAARRDWGLSQEGVGRLFGVSKMTVSKWEAGPPPDENGKVRGLPIPEELAPLVRRWVETRQAPTAEELAGRRTRRAGVNSLTGKPRRPKTKEGGSDG